MSRLIFQPAVWPMLNLNPEPMGNSMAPDSIERWYQELRNMEPEPSPCHLPKAQPIRRSGGGHYCQRRR